MINRKYLLKMIDDASGQANRDGEIIDSRPMEIISILKDKVQCRRIVYLSDGLKVHGFLLHPRRIADRLPVLIFNRAGKGEEGKIAERTINYLSLLASRDYVVLASQYRGNDGGEGQDAFGGSDIHDVLNLVPIARSLNFADAGRMGMLGYSRGGMMTYLAIKSGLPLKAAAVIGAPTDLIQTYRERKDIRESLRRLIGGTPAKCREAYVERSAIRWPEKLRVPLLILHGEDDWRVDPSHSLRLVKKLETLNLRHEFHFFPNSDHNLSAHRTERNRLVFEWFKKHLQRT